MGDKEQEQEIKLENKYRIPAWMAFTFIVGMLITGGNIVVNAITSKGNSDHAVIYEKLANDATQIALDKVAIGEQEKELSDVQKAIVLLSANQDWIMSRMKK